MGSDHFAEHQYGLWKSDRGDRLHPCRAPAQARHCQRLDWKLNQDFTTAYRNIMELDLWRGWHHMISWQRYTCYCIALTFHFNLNILIDWNGRNWVQTFCCHQWEDSAEFPHCCLSSHQRPECHRGLDADWGPFAAIWGPAVTREQGTWLWAELPPGAKGWSHNHPKSWKIIIQGVGGETHKKHVVFGCLQWRCAKQF